MKRALVTGGSGGIGAAICRRLAADGCHVLERLRVTGTARSVWPVLEMDGRIVWMREVELQPEPGIAIEARLRD